MDTWFRLIKRLIFRAYTKIIIAHLPQINSNLHKKCVLSRMVVSFESFCDLEEYMEDILTGI